MMLSASDDSAQGPALAEFVHGRFVDGYLRQSHRSLLDLAVAALLIAVLVGLRVGLWITLAWLAVVVALLIWRRTHADRAVPTRDATSAIRYVAGLLTLTGLAMAAPLAAFSTLPDTERAALSIVYIALATTSVSATSGYRMVFLGFAIPLLVPLAIAWIVIDVTDKEAHRSTDALGLLVLAYLVYLTSLGRRTFHVFRDVCRLRYAEQALNQDLRHALDRADEASRAKTHFLAAASHDLRQPLHALSVLLAALSLRVNDARSRHIVELLNSVNSTLTAQLDGLLDISRLDAGAVETRDAPVRLDHLMASHHAGVTPVAQQRGISCELKLEAEVSAYTDPHLVLRVLSNLTDNALKFTATGGTVTLGVRMESQTGQAVLMVSDTGIGIAPEEQGRVFEEFYQVGNPERDRRVGLGLGLSIVHRLGKLLKADIRLHSMLHKGTRFEIRLPAMVLTMPEAPTSMPDHSALAERHILVVDDELQVRESMALLLSEMGCVVHLAENSDQAEAIAQSQPIHGVLSDLRLRGSDHGLEAISRVRSHRPDARVALVTGDNSPDRIRQAQAAGVPLLHKPLSLQQVLKVLGCTP